jgi:N-acetyl-gamma-glutamyl-phosphate reductase
LGALLLRVKPAVQKKVFIDGQDGTTGLGIRERLARRDDVTVLEIAADRKKDADAKRALMREADLVILCLPDAAAIESVVVARTTDVKVIDASTAHRTARGFAYGMPELSEDTRRALRDARFVANPGCYPTGFLLALRPLVDAGIVGPEYPVTVHALSGYSGGGKKLIAAFSEHNEKHPGNPDWAAMPYALRGAHKHVPEMQAFAGLAHPPIFCPIAGNYYQGMVVTIPLHARLLRKTATLRDLHEVLSARYGGERFVRVMPLDGGEALVEGRLSPTGCNGTNDVELFVFGDDAHPLLLARLDNLGKGASGAAVQNLNLMLGFDEATGL